MNLGPLVEVFARFGASWSVGGRPLLVAGLVVLLGAAAFAFFPRRWLGDRRWPREIALGIVVLAGVAFAWHLRWLCDDAFISFRYARNLVDGHGLVFNPGERVEGYTNFLWTVIVAGFMRLGFDPGQVAVILGLASLAGCLLLVDRIVRRFVPGKIVPVAALLLALNYSFASFGTSGLETMFAAALMVLALERALAGASIAAGVAAAASVMSHPDHLLLAFGLGVALLWDRRLWGQAVRYGITFLALYAPYFLARWAYYGDLFPNTYYAKSGNLTYFEQGGLYLLVSTLAVGLWGPLVAAVVGHRTHSSTLLARYVAVAVPIYLVYVAKVGGDFMLGRLMCTALPPVFILAELGIRHWLAQGRRVPALGLAILAGAAVLPVRMIQPLEKRWHIADERTFYPLRSFSPVEVGTIYHDWGRGLETSVTNKGASPLLAVSCVGMVGYHSRLPLIDTYGLTDRHVAHQPIERRGRPGHEKVASAGYIFSRGADLSEIPVYPPPYHDWASLRIGTARFSIVRHHPALIEATRGDAVAIVEDVPTRLDRYLQDQIVRTPDEAACDLWYFQESYLKRAADPQRATALFELAARQGALPSGAKDFVAGAQPLHPESWEVVSSMRFDAKLDETWIQTGRAFARGPVDSAAIGQGTIAGTKGRFLSSFDPELRDGARGRLQSPPFTLQGDLLVLLVGGGRDLDRLRVSLVVDGEPVARVTGCQSEIVGPRVFDIASHRGKTGHLLVEDDSDGGWGHIIVDEVVEWKRR